MADDLLQKVHSWTKDPAHIIREDGLYITRRPFFQIGNINHNRGRLKLGKKTTYFPPFLPGLPPPEDVLKELRKNPVFGSMKEESWKKFFGEYVGMLPDDTMNIKKAMKKFLKTHGERFYVYTVYQVYVYRNDYGGIDHYWAQWKNDYTFNEKQKVWREKTKSVTTGIDSYFVTTGVDKRVFSGYKMNLLRQIFDRHNSKCLSSPTVRKWCPENHQYYNIIVRGRIDVMMILANFKDKDGNPKYPQAQFCRLPPELLFIIFEHIVVSMRLLVRV